ncbi:hypothetical protein [Clostridium butyricum]|uniref:hypothetical protein n=1 Tax=Clostridium butyricum TaxID=1492 RepID=UPI002ABDED3C|nr:hypothetical protein [Clostridium butyricum]
MQKIKLNKDFGQIVKAHGYVLDPTKEYVIDIQDELEQQSEIAVAVQTMGVLALKDFHKWLIENGFNPNEPNPTNELVSKYYGVKPLWKTDLSQGIVVKAENDDDYFIVMECSRLNEGFKYTQIIVTPGGCL